MDYFIMKTDERICKLPEIQLPKELFTLKQSKEKVKNMSATPMIYISKKTGLNIEYTDYFEKPMPLIAEKFQKILQKYQQDAVFQRVMLVEKETGQQKPYYLLLPPEIECADEVASKYDAVGNIQDFVLDTEKAGKQRIFLAKDYKKKLLVRLDVAESILRRESNGIWFEPVQTTGRSQ